MVVFRLDLEITKKAVFGADLFISRLLKPLCPRVLRHEGLSGANIVSYYVTIDDDNFLPLITTLELIREQLNLKLIDCDIAQTIIPSETKEAAEYFYMYLKAYTKDLTQP